MKAMRQFITKIRYGILHGALALTVLTIGKIQAQPWPTPLGNFWQPNGPVYSLLVTNNRVYLGGEFTRVGLVGGGMSLVKLDTAEFDRDFPTIAGHVLAVAADGQGGWYIGGAFTAVGGVEVNNLAHILPDNTVDPLWMPNPNSSNLVIVVAANRVFVGGAFSQIGGQTRNCLAALDATSGAVTDWNPNANDWVAAIGVVGDRICVGGDFTRVGGKARNRIALVDDVKGALQEWNPNANNVVNAITVSGQTLYVGGLFTTIGGKPRNRIAALNPSSAEALDWNPNADGEVKALLVEGNVVYAGGGFTSIGSANRNRLAALDPSTGLANPWNPDADGSVEALAAASGNIYAGGSFTQMGTAERRGLAGISAATGEVLPWQPILVTFTAAKPAVEALALAGNELLCGGGFSGPGALVRNNLCALDLGTGEATDWAPQVEGQVHAMRFFQDRLYIGGTFTNVGGQTRNRLAAINLASGEVLTWNPNATGRNAKVAALACSETTIYVGGAFTNVGGAARRCLAALDPETGSAAPGTADLISTATALPTVDALIFSDNILYAGGAFTNVQGETRQNLAALSAALAVILDWNPGADGPVTALYLSDSSLYVGGAFANISGQVRSRLAALNAQTGQALPWNPSAEGTKASILALGIADNTFYVGGVFSTIGGEFRNRLANLGLANAQAGSWNPNPNAAVRALAPTANAIYVGGDFTAIANLSRAYFAAFPLHTIFLPGSCRYTSTGGFEATLLSGDGKRLIVEASSDLRNWQPIQTNLPAGRQTKFSDPATGASSRFYRALLE